jgi:hypothetical protein
VQDAPRGRTSAPSLLRDSAGTEFDRKCVDALERVLARERSGELTVAVEDGYAAAKSSRFSRR